MKRNKAVYIILGLLLVLSGCSGKAANPQEPAATESNAPKTETDVPKTEVTERPVTIALNTEPDSLDPYLSAASDTEAILLNIFDGLVDIDETGKIIPDLAKDYTIADDGLKYTFDLREDVSFHNGKKLTADDVIFSLKDLSGLNGETAKSSKFENMEAVEKEGDYKVTVTLKEKDASFLSKLRVAIIPEGYGDHAKLPIGTGPYKFKAYNPGQSVILEINEDYFDKDRAGSIKEAEFVLMPDDNAKILALRSGTIDIFEAEKEIINQLPEEFNKYHSYANAVQLMALNLDREPFNNPDVRKALNYTVNRKDIVDLITGGDGYAIYTTFTPATKWYNKETEAVYSFDLEKAAKLLEEAGYKDGFDMEITVPSNYSIHVNTAQIIVDQLSKIGVRATIKQVEWGQWLEEVYTNGNYNASIVGLTGKVDPHEVAYRFYSTYGRNFYHYNNPEYDKIIDEAIIESDEDKRGSLYNEAQMILTNEAAAVFLQDPGKDVAAVTDLKGYKAYPITYWDLTALYFE